MHYVFTTTSSFQINLSYATNFLVGRPGIRAPSILFPISHISDSGDARQSLPLYPPERNEAFPVLSVESYLVQGPGRAQFLLCQKIPQTSPVVFSICGLRSFSNKTLTILSHLLLENFHDSLRLKRELPNLCKHLRLL